MILNLCGASYATSPISGDKSVSGSKEMSPLRSGRSSRYTAPASNRSPDRAVKMRSMPTVSERRAGVQNTLKQLITFSQKASSDVHRNIQKIKAQKGQRISDADIKGALGIASKFNKYALRLQQIEKSLTDNDRDIDGTLQTMTDMSQQLQDAMNKQQQSMQTLSNIMKNQHDTLKSIINNLR